MKKSPPHRKVPHHLSKTATEPVVIHHTDETVLAKWVHAAFDKGPRYWVLVVGCAALLVAALIALNGWIGRPSSGARAWSEFMVPSTVSALEESASTEGMSKAVRPFLRIADEHPATEAARWALLRAGQALYEEGFRDLPNQREVARPKLRQAIEQFDRVLESAPPNSPEAVTAAMCKARALETEGELNDAIAQYRLVAKKWPDSKEATEATRRADRLEEPDVRKFYHDFYELNFATVTPSDTGRSPGGVPPPIDLSPRSSERFGIPLVPPLPRDSTPGGNAPKPPSDQGVKDLPNDVFAPSSIEPKPAENDVKK